MSSRKLNKQSLNLKKDGVMQRSMLSIEIPLGDPYQLRSLQMIMAILKSRRQRFIKRADNTDTLPTILNTGASWSQATGLYISCQQNNSYLTRNKRTVLTLQPRRVDWF